MLFNLENGQVVLNYVKTLGFIFFVIVLSLIFYFLNSVKDFNKNKEVLYCCFICS